MLLSSALYKCCTKHSIQQAFCNVQKYVKSINARGLASSSSQLFVRGTPRHFVNQTRGAKSYKQRQQEEWKQKNKTILTYITAAGVGMIGMSYASVPLYRLYCQVSAKQFLKKSVTQTYNSIIIHDLVMVYFVPQATGLGGTATAGHDSDLVETMQPVKDRIIKVTFNADTHASLQWNFRPQQSEIYV